MADPALLPIATEAALVGPPRDLVRTAAAQLYGRGMKRADIARALAPRMRSPGFEDNPYHKDSMKYVRKKLRVWEQDPEFRDLIYYQALADLDLEVPEILKGVAGKARKGRVDAARLVLEVTGRHNPKGEQQPTNITIQIANVPRPESG